MYMLQPKYIYSLGLRQGVANHMSDILCVRSVFVRWYWCMRMNLTGIHIYTSWTEPGYVHMYNENIWHCGIWQWTTRVSFYSDKKNQPRVVHCHSIWSRTIYKLCDADCLATAAVLLAGCWRNSNIPYCDVKRVYYCCITVMSFTEIQFTYKYQHAGSTRAVLTFTTTPQNRLCRGMHNNIVNRINHMYIHNWSSEQVYTLCTELAHMFMHY